MKMEDIPFRLLKEAGTFVPKLISRGNHRIVWTMEDPATVLKLPRYNTRFDANAGLRKNLEEWLVWQMASSRLRPWLCQPVRLDYGGLGLVMERGQPITKEELPDKVPGIIAKNDNTYPNWVKVNGLYKRCDYHTLYTPITKRKQRIRNESGNSII